MKMDYFLDDWCQDAELEVSAFGACQLVACSLGVVELVHLKLSPKQLVMTVLEYLTMLVIESQEANQPKLLQLFQL
jgi:predicted alpha/beta hydrolase family esterase